MRKSVHVSGVWWSQSAWLFPRMRLLKCSNVTYAMKLDSKKPLRKVGNKLRIDTASYPGRFWSSWNLTPYRNRLDVELSVFLYFRVPFLHLCRCASYCLCTWMSSAKEFFSLTLILLTWKIRWAPNNVSNWQMGFNSAFKGLIRFCLNPCNSTAACWIPTTCFTSCYHKTF